MISFHLSGIMFSLPLLLCSFNRTTQQARYLPTHLLLFSTLFFNSHSMGESLNEQHVVHPSFFKLYSGTEDFLNFLPDFVERFFESLHERSFPALLYNG